MALAQLATAFGDGQAAMADGRERDTTEDSLLNGRLRLRQPKQGYRVAIDPVFLAAAVPARDGQMALDVGCGVGAAALCLVSRVPGCRVFGIELQAELAALARDNVQLNGLGGRVDVLTGSLLAPPPRLAPGSFHHVLSNPPYLPSGRADASPDAGKALCDVEGEADLDRWLRFCLAMLRPKGTLTLIHRADRLDDLLAAVHGKVGAATVHPLWPKAGRPAKRILLRARKGVAGPLALVPGTVLHRDDGSFTAEAEAILRHGWGLEPDQP